MALTSTYTAHSIKQHATRQRHIHAYRPTCSTHQKPNCTSPPTACCRNATAPALLQELWVDRRMPRAHTHTHPAAPPPHPVGLNEVIQRCTLQCRARQHQPAANHGCSKVQAPAGGSKAARRRQGKQLEAHPETLTQTHIKVWVPNVTGFAEHADCGRCGRDRPGRHPEMTNTQHTNSSGPLKQSVQQLHRACCLQAPHLFAWNMGTIMSTVLLAPKHNASCMEHSAA